MQDSKSCGKDTPDKNLDKESSNSTKAIRKKSRFYSRPCPFCGRLQSKLVRHLKTKHKTEPAIIAAMKKDKVNCLKDFWSLRIEGIFKYNRRKLTLRRPAELIYKSLFSLRKVENTSILPLSKQKNKSRLT